MTVRIVRGGCDSLIKFAISMSIIFQEHLFTCRLHAKVAVYVMSASLNKSKYLDKE